MHLVYHCVHRCGIAPHFTCMSFFYLIFDNTLKSLSQVREIKCPHCGEWTMWAGKVDDRCLYCDGFLEPQRFSREVEKKVNLELLKENDYLFVKPGDGAFTRWIKK